MSISCLILLSIISRNVNPSFPKSSLFGFCNNSQVNILSLFLNLSPKGVLSSTSANYMRVVCSMFVVWSISEAFVMLLETSKPTVWRVDCLFVISLHLFIVFSFRLFEIRVDGSIWLSCCWLIWLVLYRFLLSCLGITWGIWWLLCIYFCFFVWMYSVGVSIVSFVSLFIFVYILMVNSVFYLCMWCRRIFFLGVERLTPMMCIERLLSFDDDRWRCNVLGYQWL